MLTASCWIQVESTKCLRMLSDLARWTEGELLIALSSTDLQDHEQVKVENEWLKRKQQDKDAIAEIVPL